LSSKEHCHGCGKLWSEESPDCLFNYHRKPDESQKITKHIIVKFTCSCGFECEGLEEYEKHSEAIQS